MFCWLKHLLKLRRFLREDRTAVPYFPEDQSGPYIPGFEVEDTGTGMPESKSISGIFCRWHSHLLVPPIVPLWQSFLDDDRKWSSQGRFAGANRNCGHFFALSEDGATAEAKHYGVNLTECKMLQVKANLDKVLDLTTPSGRNLAFEAVVENPDASDAFIAEEIIEEVTSGTALTDHMGLWAANRGYEGILYLAPRLLWQPETKAQENTRPRKIWDYDLFPLYEQMFRDSSELNLVVFRGRYLLSRITEFRIGQDNWLQNDLFGSNEDEIEAQLSTSPEYLEFGAEYQRKRKVIMLGKIKYQDH
jgi:hypothetical protein